MDEANIRKYAKLMREEDLSGLEITEDGMTVRLERAVAEPVYQVPQSAPMAQTAAVQTENADESSFVTSPMVGVVYLAPTENSDPYVQPGDKVKAGDILCIVEAMKLMNMIQAEYDGTIAEICITDGQVVEYGTKLFRIER